MKPVKRAKVYKHKHEYIDEGSEGWLLVVNGKRLSHYQSKEAASWAFITDYSYRKTI